MKLLFVDHAFHRKTRSADFFVDVLRGFFDVTILYAEPGKAEQPGLASLGDAFDVVILWQLDYLAPLVLAQGVPTIVVPMFDGSSEMPDLHWLWARGARFISFSRRLHHRLSRLGLDSLLLRYFKPPARRPDPSRFDDGLKVLLWQRRPAEGINLRAIETLFGSQLKAVHIHDAADDARLDTRPYLERSIGGYALTTSTWFDSRQGFTNLMDRHNVLMTPRRAEGIGMVMLEGLSRGMLVAAADAPTHDEYICNWVNGILFNPVAVGHAHVHDPRSIGDMAWRGVVEGHEAWRASEPRIIDWIRGAQKPRRHVGADIDAVRSSLARAYRRGGKAYQAYLLGQQALIGAMSGLDLAGVLDKAGTYDPDRPKLKRDGHLLSGPVPEWLAQNRLAARDLIAGRYLIEGTVRARDGVADAPALIGAAGIELAFCVDPRLGAANVLRLTLADAPDCGCDVRLNGRRLRGRPIEGGVDFSLPEGLLRIDNHLSIRPAAAPPRGKAVLPLRTLELAAS
jgi:hypothetical protein